MGYICLIALYAKHAMWHVVELNLRGSIMIWHTDMGREATDTCMKAVGLGRVVWDFICINVFQSKFTIHVVIIFDIKFILATTKMYSFNK